MMHSYHTPFLPPERSRVNVNMYIGCEIVCNEIQEAAGYIYKVGGPSAQLRDEGNIPVMEVNTWGNRYIRISGI